MPVRSPGRAYIDGRFQPRRGKSGRLAMCRAGQSVCPMADHALPGLEVRLQVTQLCSVAAAARGARPASSGSWRRDGVRRLEDLRPGLLDEIEAFFGHYNALGGRSFTPLGRGGPERARELVEAGVAAQREREQTQSATSVRLPP